MITIPSPQRITGIFIVYDFTLRSKTNVRHTQLRGSYNISIRERLIISYLVPHLDVGFVSPANLIRAASARRTPTRNSRHASGRTERVYWSSKSFERPRYPICSHKETWGYERDHIGPVVVNLGWLSLALPNARSVRSVITWCNSGEIERELPLFLSASLLDTYLPTE